MALTESSSSSSTRRSFFSRILQPTRRLQQRLAFHNRWKKQGVKFNPKFIFIIGQLVIKTIVQTNDGVMYPESSSETKQRKKMMKTKKKGKKNKIPNAVASTPVKSTPSSASYSATAAATTTTSMTPFTSPATSIRSEYGLSTTSKSTADTDKVFVTKNGLRNESKNQEEQQQQQNLCLDCTENCPICWEGYEVGDKVCWSMNEKCHHAFHFDCMVMWLVDADHCPLCRSPYLIEKYDKKKKRNSINRRRGSNNNTSNRNRRTTSSNNNNNSNNYRTSHYNTRGTNSATNNNNTTFRVIAENSSNVTSSNRRRGTRRN